MANNRKVRGSSPRGTICKITACACNIGTPPIPNCGLRCDTFKSARGARPTPNAAHPVRIASGVSTVSKYTHIRDMSWLPYLSWLEREAVNLKVGSSSLPGSVLSIDGEFVKCDGFVISHATRHANLASAKIGFAEVHGTMTRSASQMTKSSSQLGRSASEMTRSASQMTEQASQFPIR